ncbi:MAG: D-glycerate dehydrogenase [Candidatus Terrybacteria bacterium RIFCSPHIGHO2_01_FULL_48_17]|uniref:D-glycerate dehydrogenase n=1 Tax=Candidatus Terrybacteria bacterium RIFCSPHIGHO2_01_FULL_48_17 TaxID=1802362 RepID=A0A1G2PII9_9BACT|nr:MAG: D-glycerate dehydrogenase [Candidatus Terrybacteria bacterium RIFCSPHIGHO2_01_FULL_48_17]OHA53856.1 MAG: D-glycerate dehydrogenase [Candidatus Terrybacteria bacterium RIFCSPLOWO2_01_FULL_48_14]
MKIFITRQIPEDGPKLLREQGHEVIVASQDAVISRPALIQSVKGIDALLSLLTDKIDAEVMDAAGKQLKIIANYAVGFDNIDVVAAQERGIVITNTPDVLSETVAEHTFALMLAIAHRIPEADRFTRAGKYRGWEPMLLLGRDLSHKILGIVGLGRIGSLVAKHAVKGFDMRAQYYDVKPNSDFEKEYGATYMQLEDLLREADFVSIHVPLVPATRHLINAERLKIMKSSAYLINTSRGPVIEEMVLVEALRKGTIAGAALDVFENEPSLTSGLANLENVILTPHTASATIETRGRMAELAAQNIIAVLSGKEPLTAVKLKS